MESLYNSALSAISKLKREKIDSVTEEKETTINALEEEKEAAEESYQAQIDAIEDMVEAKEKVIEGIEAEIEGIEEIIDGYNERIDAINAEIDAMREANEERKRAIDLQKAEYELERMQNQRTQLVYKDGHMVYQNDSAGIRDAREKVEDAKLEIAIAEKEKEIKAIEALISQKEKEIDQKEKSISLVEKEIDAFNKQKDAIQKAQEESEKYYTTLIEQQEKYFETIIKNLEEQKSKWEELAQIKEVADAYSPIQQVFGGLGYSVEDVLNDSAGAFDAFKTQYVDLMNALNPNDSFGQGLGYAVGELDKTLSEVGTNTQGLDTLPGKIKEINATVADTADAFDGGEESLSNAVQGVIDKVAGGSGGGSKQTGEESNPTAEGKKEKSEGDANSLVGAIQTQYDKTNEVVPEQIDIFTSFKEIISGCVAELNNMIAAMEKISTMSVGGVVSPIPGHAEGTVGKAFAKGYNGLPRNEKNALRSEYGQPELTVYPDGTTELTTQPVMSDLPKDTVIFNEEQTRRIINGKGTILGNAYANGTVLEPATTIKGIDIKHLQDAFLGKLDNIIVPMNSIDRNVQSLVGVGNNIHTNNASQDINISIGDIQLHEVQDVNGLANAISTKLPNVLLQTMTKRK